MHVIKQLPLLILTLSLSVVLNSCSNFSLGGGYPDLTQAFPKNKFLGQHQVNPKRQSYTYITLKNFDTSKTEFEQFLGKNWASLPGAPEVNNSIQNALKKSKNKVIKKLKVSGSKAYMSPKYPDTMLLMIHLKSESMFSTILIYEDKK